MLEKRAYDENFTYFDENFLLILTNQKTANHGKKSITHICLYAYRPIGKPAFPDAD
jgi:hypothetical protein